jgi:sulfate permease, SulP family
MIMVSIGTFDWSSFTYLVKAPKSDAVVMLVTVIIVVATHDLSKGVIAGVILSAIFFVAKISTIKVKERLNDSDKIFEVEGQLFFASVEGFVESFNFSVQNTNIIIDFTNAHIWDDSAVGAIDKVVLKYRENNNNVTIKGLDSASKRLVEKLAIYNQTNPKLSSH